MDIFLHKNVSRPRWLVLGFDRKPRVGIHKTSVISLTSFVMKASDFTRLHLSCRMGLFEQIHERYILSVVVPHGNQFENRK
jgi:hypothetical protein